jgi:thiol-disulfide isomerase/thioredoxin
MSVVGAAVIASACACSAASTTSLSDMRLTIFPATDRHATSHVRGTTLDGASFTLASLRGHVVVVNVWASWCRPCREESGVMAAGARRFAAVGVRFVGVDEHDDASSARSFSAAAGENYPELSDPHGQVLSQLPDLPQMGIPSTLVLDRRGRAAARVIGPASRSLLDRAVRSVLGTR